MSEPAEAAGLPPGRLRIDREGAWLHDGHEVTHPGVLASLWASLGCEGGQHYVAAGPRRVPVDVADAPLVVTRAEVQAGAEPRVGLHLSDGSVETLDPSSLRLDPRGTPYCRAKAGRLAARLSVAAWLELASLLAADESGTLLVLGRRRFRLSP